MSFLPMNRVMARCDPTYFPSPDERPQSDLAAAARLLDLLRDGRDCRRVKVRSIRRSVKRQHYENDLKLTIAVERLLGDVPPF